MKQVLVIGLGYVGLVQLLGCANRDKSSRYEFTGMDSDKQRIEDLKNGKLPIHEEGLQEILDRNLEKIHFITSEELIGQKYDIVFSCVGTPMAEDGSSDMSYVSAVADLFAETQRDDCLFVNKSTCPVGTCDIISDEIGHSERVISNPEFLQEGIALRNFNFPDRIVIGGKRNQDLKQFYEDLGFENIMLMKTCKEAEMTKYASNTILAVRVALINEIAEFCESKDIDVDNVLNGIWADKRIGSTFYHPGPGYGGSCFPKDVESLFYQSENTMWIVGATIESNLAQCDKLSNVLIHAVHPLENVTLGIVGAAFKDDTDDMRNSQADLILDNIYSSEYLKDRISEIRLYDACMNEHMWRYVQESICGQSIPIETTNIITDLKDCDIVIVINIQDPDKELLLKMLTDSLCDKYIIDARMHIPIDIIEKRPGKYWGIGRGGHNDVYDPWSF